MRPEYTVIGSEKKDDKRKQVRGHDLGFRARKFLDPKAARRVRMQVRIFDNIVERASREMIWNLV
jgi:hypothetical protein